MAPQRGQGSTARRLGAVLALALLSGCAVGGGWPKLNDPLPQPADAAVSARFPTPPAPEHPPRPDDPAALWDRVAVERRAFAAARAAGLDDPANRLAAQLHLTRLGRLARALAGAPDSGDVAGLDTFVAEARRALANPQPIG
ncbi:hypothetical protein [Rhodothalassium salexigens]|uniref:hypothetical protein n=1 Tax=Rhodothalassium salexigens TaxID=1086 RepID=UPI001914CA88|nr:hypothetical protein [Rhodothalassium salexigens]